MLIVSNHYLLADAEVLKYVLKRLVGGDFAANFGEVGGAGAEVFADEVGAEACGEGLAGAAEVVEREEQGTVVAGVGNGHSRAGIGDEAAQKGFYSFDVRWVLGGDGHYSVNACSRFLCDGFDFI